ncbi:MAG: acyl-CoA/acyl-ACP dehydrogenase [Dehalococcoidia bacterium]|nr:MAG: acyl-CoA/acyl-ACP dehydrogenase [Dehalococcoidia bacterium]
MDLSYNEVQQMLGKTARDFMERECPGEVALQLSDSDTGFSADIWRKMAELGWVGMVLPEKYGGMERGLADLAVVYEEMGWAALPSPHLSSAVLCALTILAAGNEEQKQQLLPAISRGERILAFAFTEPDFGWGPESVHLTATPGDNGFTLDGTKLFVPDIQIADEVLCVARTGNAGSPEEGITLLLVDRESPGISWRSLTGFQGEKLNEVTFSSVEIPRSGVVGELDKGWAALAPALEKATALLCAYMVGGCRRVFELTAEYSRTRVQFGVNIGAFQRVQDHIIEMLNGLDGARWATYYALWKLDEGEPAGKAVSLAKAVISDVYWRACQSAHDVHAGAGVMKEYPLHIYTRQSCSLYHYLGDPVFHRKRLARLLEL